MERNTKIIIGIFIAVLILAGAIFVLAPKKDGYMIFEKTPIKIGVFAVLSGEAAEYGKAIQNGLDIAVEDINSNGGVLGRQLELVYEDTHLDPKSAVAVMNKFANVDGFDFVIAAEGSGATLAAAPFADQTKTLMMVAIASTPNLKDSGDYVFRVVPSDDYQGKEIAKIAKNSGYKKAAILYVNDAYGVGINDVFSEEFGNVAAQESFDSGATDIRTQLAKIKSASPDVIVVVARQEFPVILKQAKELGITSQIITSAEFKDSALIKASGGQQQMLALGRALMQSPALLMLDEPSLGLSPKLQKELFAMIKKLKKDGISILVVEQNAKKAIEIADRTYLLEDGRVALTGGKNILKNKKIRNVYLGGRF